MSEAIKPTPGPWSKGYSVNGACCVWLDGHTEPYADMGENSTWIDCETVGNATLIAEAGNVFHETGLTPRQLVDRMKAVESAMRDAREMIEADHVDAAYQMLGEAITNLVKREKP